MIKTGKHIRIISALLLSLFLISGAQAQDITVNASLTETNFFSGEGVRLDVKVSGQSINSIDRPDIPNTDGLRWLSGSTSTSQNFTYVNGRPSVSYTYGYQFIAQAPGTYTFPPLEVTVNGETYTTNEISFKVLDPKTIDTGQAERSPDIYVRLEPTKERPVVGEQVIADIVLYFKNSVEVSSYQASPGWKAEGFWKEELENRQQARTTSTIINGVRYQRAVLLQYALFPTKSGELTLSPFEVVVQIRQRNQRRDIFSFGLGQERKELATLPVTIDVASLPELDNATFSGGVGNFSITRSINPTKAYVGESVEVVTTITGQGNIPLIVKPEYEYPETLELYNPQENSTITRSNRQIGGTKIFTDILIARNEGSFEIPESRLAYFSPAQGRYNTITLPALVLEAERDPRATSITDTELRFNVEPITGLASWVSNEEVPLSQQKWVWLLLGLPLLILGGAFGFKTYHDKMNSDTAFARSQKAKEKALDELQKAEGQTDLKVGYNHIQKALSQLISDKLNLPLAGLSIQQLSEALKEKSGTEIADEVKRILDKCDTIAYAPNASIEGMESDIKKARELIKQINKVV
ncbi:MAG: protein BatD [Balneolaceae bacterium]|nr:protein BatD [Balneolaceae bacterium]MBO6545306.1 protein BatD [Balneolaceae bacterium]MBO6646702.1 protein BatD [Balneolaceae bacterium]